jgi:hypothetical protein
LGNYAVASESCFHTTREDSDLFGLFGGGFDGAGVTTGGLDFGGVFLLSSFFCAETATDKPTTTANVNNIFRKTLIVCFSFSS